MQLATLVGLLVAWMSLARPCLVAGVAVPGSSGSLSGVCAAWRWSFLDATPDEVDPEEGTPFPFKLGVADRDPRDRAGERFVPAIRYAHASVALARSMVITHGYHYDMSIGGGGATWLSDTWSFDFDRHRWTRLHDHVRHPEEGPVARYAAIAFVLGGDLYLHGGDDGGHAEGLPSYRHTVYGDLWRFILQPSAGHPLHTWVRVRTAVEATMVGRTSHRPSTFDMRTPRDDLYRCQHAGALAPIGSEHEIWKLDDALESTHLAPSQPAAAPYLFVTHGLHAVERDRSKDSGGVSPSAAAGGTLSEEFDVLDSTDVWVLSFRSKLWRQVRTSEPAPPGRFGHQIVYVPNSSSAAGRQADQPSGSLYLYGGFSRSGGNHGDLWMLPLQTGVGVGGALAFTWVSLHPSYPDGAGRSPGSRGYFNLFWTPDGHLHLFGGARCEPGCVCSAEYWLWDLAQSQWTLLADSPHSPASRHYPARTASGAPKFATLTTPDESVAAGYPVHRYKQSLVLAAPTATSTAGAPFQAYLFGGESYNPSAYYQDVWRFDYTPAAGRVSEAAHRSFVQLAGLLHDTTLPSFDVPLARHREVAPAPFHTHTPPGGWGEFRPRQQRVWSWPESRHLSSRGASAADDATTFWLIVLGTMAGVLAVGAGLAWCMLAQADRWSTSPKAHRI